MDFIGSQFETWWSENMQGFGVSEELEKLLAKAFAGGVEAVTGRVESGVEIIDIMKLTNIMRKHGGTLMDTGTPKYVMMWPTPSPIRHKLSVPSPPVEEEVSDACDYEDKDDYDVPSKAKVLSAKEITDASMKLIGKVFDSEYTKGDWGDVLEEVKLKARAERTITPTSGAAKEQLEQLRRRVTKVKY